MTPPTAVSALTGAIGYVRAVREIDARNSKVVAIWVSYCLDLELLFIPYCNQDDSGV